MAPGAMGVLSFELSAFDICFTKQSCVVTTYNGFRRKTKASPDVKGYQIQLISPVFFSECVALFDYAGIDGDLTFNEGDVIKITKKEGDWWEGMIRGETGFFPANYVTVKEQQEVKLLLHFVL